MCISLVSIISINGTCNYRVLLIRSTNLHDPSPFYFLYLSWWRSSMQHKLKMWVILQISGFVTIWVIMNKLDMDNRLNKWFSFDWYIDRLELFISQIVLEDYLPSKQSFEIHHIVFMVERVDQTFVMCFVGAPLLKWQ